MSKVTEKGWGRITILAFALGKIKRAAIESAGGSCLKAFQFETQVPEGVADRGNSIAHPATLLVLLADVHESPHEGSGT